MAILSRARSRRRELVEVSGSVAKNRTVAMEDGRTVDYSIIHSVMSFEIVAAYTLRIHFEDGVSRTVNFENVLGGALFRPLRDIGFFKQVFISEGIPTLTWPNGADFNPDHLYDWPRFEALYIERAENWEKQESAAHSH